MHKIINKITLLSLCAAGIASAAVIYVDNDMSDGFWQGAYASLKNAISVAQAGDEIWVAQGIYTPGVNRDDSFILKPGVKLYGGFYGGEVSRDDRDVHEHRPVLSGDIGVIDNISDNCYHVIRYSGSMGDETLLDGFQIRDGNAEDEKGGGGLLLENGAAPLIVNCHFHKNISSSQGGAASIQNGVHFEYCLFESNSAINGGAVACLENRDQTGKATFDHCSFVLNTAATGSGLYFEKRESAVLDSCVFWSNTNGSGKLNSLYLDTRISESAVRNSAFDDESVIAVSVSNIVFYTSSDVDGPFLNTDDYHLDNEHGIPREWGWYYIPAPLVLNIKVFLEGAF